MTEPSNDEHHLCYSVEVMVLSKERPRMIRYRWPEPALMPLLPQERSGTVPTSPSPTGINRRDDLGPSQQECHTHEHNQRRNEADDRNGLCDQRRSISASACVRNAD